jgi:hypothetical protein
MSRDPAPYYESPMRCPLHHKLEAIDILTVVLEENYNIVWEVSFRLAMFTGYM